MEASRDIWPFLLFLFLLVLNLEEESMVSKNNILFFPLRLDPFLMFFLFLLTMFNRL